MLYLYTRYGALWVLLPLLNLFVQLGDKTPKIFEIIIWDLIHLDIIFVCFAFIILYADIVLLSEWFDGAGVTLLLLFSLPPLILLIHFWAFSENWIGSQTWLLKLFTHQLLFCFGISFNPVLESVISWRFLDLVLPRDFAHQGFVDATSFLQLMLFRKNPFFMNCFELLFETIFIYGFLHFQELFVIN